MKNKICVSGMKVLGVFLFILAGFTAFLAYSFFPSPQLATAEERSLEASKKSYEFSKTAEKIMELEGHPVSFNSADTRESYASDKEQYANTKEDRDKKILITFGVAAFFFLSGILCLNSR